MKIGVCSLKKSYGSIAVLDDLTFEIAQGGFVAIIGPSGCGKSTLLSCLAGFEPWEEGTITIDGEPVVRPSPKRMYLFQEPSAFPWLSVKDNVLFGLQHGGLAKERQTMERAYQYLDLVGLSGFAEAMPCELSGGMKQRLEFARILATEADVLFLDEPFGALDALLRLEMRKELLRIWRATGKTCVLVTHDVEEALYLAEQVIVLSKRPARIREALQVPLLYPRDVHDPAFRSLRVRGMEILDGT